MLRQELTWTFAVSTVIFALLIVAHLFVEAWCLWSFVLQTQGQCDFHHFFTESRYGGEQSDCTRALFVVGVVGIKSLRQLCIFTALKSPKM